jgi:hypothetical protein
MNHLYEWVSPFAKLYQSLCKQSFISRFASKALNSRFASKALSVALQAKL